MDRRRVKPDSGFENLNISVNSGYIRIKEIENIQSL